MNGQLSPEQLKVAVDGTLAKLSAMKFIKDKSDLLQVLMHIMAAALEGRNPQEVAAYFMKIMQMLDGRFDR